MPAACSARTVRRDAASSAKTIAIAAADTSPTLSGAGWISPARSACDSQTGVSGLMESFSATVFGMGSILRGRVGEGQHAMVERLGLDQLQRHLLAEFVEEPLAGADDDRVLQQDQLVDQPLPEEGADQG